jgi:Zn-dependent protease
MLCRRCRRKIERADSSCAYCGLAQSDVGPSLDLVVDGRSRIPITGEVTIGRAPGNTVQLSDPSVSRWHARIAPANDGSGGTATIEDVGSSYGTWLDGGRLDTAGALHDGSRIRVGSQELFVERRRNASEAGRTFVVPPGASAALRAARPAVASATATTRFGIRPRLRSGYALKRLAAAEGPNRWVLKRLDSGRFVELSDANEQLLSLLDGERTLPDLVGEAERRHGGGGRARLVSLLSDLSDGGFLTGTGATAAEGDQAEPAHRRRLVREWSFTGAADVFERIYDAGGWRLFTRTARAGTTCLTVVGLAAFALLVVFRYGTPFVVSKKIGLGGLVFLLGRAGVVTVHEAAHGLTMTSFGRRPGRAGLKLVLVFPYAFVDTSDMWFEPRRRRIAVSAAGPVSDFTLAGAFSLVCAAMPPGTLRQIVFQLAFAAYVGGVFNLSPLLERDGYYILVDVLREPQLRSKARAFLRGRLSGRREARQSKALARYAYFSLAWSVGTSLFVGATSLRYRAELATLVPRPVADLILASLWIAVLLPALTLIVPPLADRLRRTRD